MGRRIGRCLGLLVVSVHAAVFLLLLQLQYLLFDFDHLFRDAFRGGGNNFVLLLQQTHLNFLIRVAPFLEFGDLILDFLHFCQEVRPHDSVVPILLLQDAQRVIHRLLAVQGAIIQA